MVNCKVCNLVVRDYRELSRHIKGEHQITSEDYHIKYIGRGQCKFCGNKTSFKNLNIGFRPYCSVLCLNRHKATSEDYLKKLSVSQKGIPRKKHTEETKLLCKQIMLTEWSQNRKRRLEISKNPVRNEKLSKTISSMGCLKRLYVVHNIRCESLLEKEFVEMNINKSIPIKRFEIDGNLSIQIGRRWCIPDFIVGTDMIVEVKDYHHWFRKELSEGLQKYFTVENWCVNNGYKYRLWFKQHGYLTTDEVLRIWQQSEQKTKN